VGKILICLAKQRFKVGGIPQEFFTLFECFHLHFCAKRNATLGNKVRKCFGGGNKTFCGEVLLLQWFMLFPFEFLHV